VSPRAEDDHADDDDLPAEDEEGQEGASETPLFAPPGDDDFDNIKYFAGLEQLPSAFSAALNRDYLRRPYSAFAVRFGGDDERTGGFDPKYFTERVLQAAKLNHWVAKAAFKDVGWPGVLATVPGSLIAHFTIAAGEERIRLGRETDYPTIAGARAVARLFAAAGDEDELLQAVRPLGKNAVKTLLGTLDDSVNLDLTVNWLTREGQYVRLTPKRAELGVEILNIVPEMVSTPPVLISGQIDHPDKGHGQVRVIPLHGAPMLLHFSPELEEKIREAWGKFIVGTMVVEEPENPSLPRAPRRVRTLRRIRAIFGSEEELVRNLNR
jgi:hypothetical protein